MTRLVLSALLLLGLLSACADRSGRDLRVVLGSPSSKSEGGIGGTGSPTRDKTVANGEDKEGGIGGTGIFGTVTAFGSIIVNGQAIAFNEEVIQPHPALHDKTPPLNVGSAVIVEARPEKNGWIADHMSSFLPLIGPVTSMDPAIGELSVMGTSVRLDKDAVIVDQQETVGNQAIGLELLSPGDRLAVSGIWKGGEIVASRIDRLDDNGQDSLSGLLLETEGGFILGGTKLRSDCCQGQSTPAFAQILGSYENDQFAAGQFETGAALIFSDDIDQLIVEAFLARDPVGDGFHLSGFGIPADQSATVAAPSDERSLFVGDYDRSFDIHHSLPLPEDPAAREGVLQSLGDLSAPQ